MVTERQLLFLWVGREERKRGREERASLVVGDLVVSSWPAGGSPARAHLAEAAQQQLLHGTWHSQPGGRHAAWPLSWPELAQREVVRASGPCVWSQLAAAACDQRLMCTRPDHSRACLAPALPARSSPRFPQAHRTDDKACEHHCAPKHPRLHQLRGYPSSRATTTSRNSPPAIPPRSPGHFSARQRVTAWLVRQLRRECAVGAGAHCDVEVSPSHGDGLCLHAAATPAAPLRVPLGCLERYLWHATAQAAAVPAWLPRSQRRCHWPTTPRFESLRGTGALAAAGRRESAHAMPCRRH